MKTYTMHSCDFCKNESRSYDEIAECEAKHLGLTVQERAKYLDLQEAVKLCGLIVSRSNNQENRDMEEKVIKEVIDFERKHGIKLN